LWWRQCQVKGEPGLKSRLTRKHVLIAIISLIVTALVVVGVVLSVHIYTDSSVEVLKVRHALYTDMFAGNNGSTFAGSMCTCSVHVSAARSLQARRAYIGNTLLLGKNGLQPGTMSPNMGAGPGRSAQ